MTMNDCTLKGTGRMLTSLDGINIYADAAGDPSKPSIVFIHGFALSSVVFDNIFSDPIWLGLFYLVRYDMRGHGRSGKPTIDAAWESKSMADDFDTVVDAFGLHRPFVAGWSLGGTVPTDILTFHPPDYLSGIIYITPLPYTDSLLFEKVVKAFARYTIALLLQTTDVDAFQHGARGFVAGLVAPKNEVNPFIFSDRLRHALLGDLMSQPRSCAKFALYRSQDPTGLLQAGQGGQLPLILIKGREDLLADGDCVPEAIEGWLDFEAVDLDVGHMPWLEAPDDFRDAVVGWITRVSTKKLI